MRRVHRLPSPARSSWSIAGVVVAIALATLPGGSARAIIGGQADGTSHPYVAGIDGGIIVYSGVAISPTVVLTAAHAVRIAEGFGVTTGKVTFDPVASASSVRHVGGTIYVHPDYDPTFVPAKNDLAVVVFASPITSTPAALPTAGWLDALRPAQLRRETFELVGYGISRVSGGSTGGGMPVLDFGSTGTRHVAEQTFSSLTSSWLRATMNGSAEVCIGDSGAPSLLGNVVVGIAVGEMSLSGGQCQSQPWDMRVDTPDARRFLRQFVSLP